MTTRTECLDPMTPMTNIGHSHNTLDDELNQRTGIPHWTAVVDELTDHLMGRATVDNVEIEILIDCVKYMGCALEDAIVEINALNGLINKIEGDEITQEQMKQLANANKYVYAYLTTPKDKPMMRCSETFDNWIDLSEDKARQILIEIMTDQILDGTHGIHDVPQWLDEVLDNIPLLLSKEILRREEYRKEMIE